MFIATTAHLEVVEGPHEVGPQALRRFVGDLDAILENRHGKAGARARGQPQPAERQEIKTNTTNPQRKSTQQNRDPNEVGPGVEERLVLTFWSERLCEMEENINELK